MRYIEVIKTFMLSLLYLQFHPLNHSDQAMMSTEALFYFIFSFSIVG
uniref:Uncharacterized protein n=1 Tax=Rhizophora mucronata TaxID=61149 RepID=A0A2P2JE51_RHIMU